MIVDVLSLLLFALIAFIPFGYFFLPFVIFILFVFDIIALSIWRRYCCHFQLTLFSASLLSTRWFFIAWWWQFWRCALCCLFCTTFVVFGIFWRIFSVFISLWWLDSGGSLPLFVLSIFSGFWWRFTCVLYPFFFAFFVFFFWFRCLLISLSAFAGVSVVVSVGVWPPSAAAGLHRLFIQQRLYLVKEELAVGLLSAS